MVCIVVWRAMEEGSQLSEQLKVIFDLCDADRDGVIAVEDFRRIALEHFGKNQVKSEMASVPSGMAGEVARAVEMRQGMIYLTADMRMSQ